LLDRVHSNIKAGFNEFSIFEINPVHGKDLLDKATGLPIEQVRLGFVAAADDRVAGQKYQGAAYYEAKKYATDLLEQFNCPAEFTEATDFGSKQPLLLALLAPFEIQRTAIIKARNGEFIGAVGEFKLDVRTNFKLPKFIAGFELDVEMLAKAQTSREYVELPRFPYEHQDICLRVDSRVSYQQLQSLIETVVSSSYPASADFTITPVDIYQNPADPTKKQITFGLSIASYDRTLTTDEVNILLNNISERAKSEFEAIRV
jgi:phenylalanyl-tRNA synthetase beta subunit